MIIGRETRTDRGGLTEGEETIECFLTTCSCPGGGKGTRDNLAENSLIVSSKSACLAGRNWTRRLGDKRWETE